MSTPALLYAAARVQRDAYGAPPRPRGNLLHFCGGYIRALIGSRPPLPLSCQRINRHP
jgi:hypothetical protein